jgi:hypothetical protein
VRLKDQLRYREAQHRDPLHFAHFPWRRHRLPTGITDHCQGAAVLAGLALRAWLREPLAIVLQRTTLHLSPHGLAPAVSSLESGSAVRILRHGRGWVMVEAPGAQRGWLADEAVAAVGG